MLKAIRVGNKGGHPTYGLFVVTYGLWPRMFVKSPFVSTYYVCELGGGVDGGVDGGVAKFDRVTKKQHLTLNII